MISAEQMLWHECCGSVPRAHRSDRMESRERRMVDVLVEILRGLREVYILCIKFVSANVEVQNRRDKH